MNGTIFGIGPLEVLVVAILILVVVGPERVPGLMRDLGRMTRSLRKYYVAFSSELKREMEPFQDDIKGITEAAKGLRDDLGAIAQAADIRGIINPTDLKPAEAAAQATAVTEQTIAPPAVTAAATAAGQASAAAPAVATMTVVPPAVRFDVPVELDEDSPWLQAFQPPRADRLDDDSPWAA